MTAYKMDDVQTIKVPDTLPAIESDTRDFGFDMSSERQAGALLRALVASKPNGRFLELGTGTGLCTSWILDGMSPSSSLVSIDIDQKASAIAHKHLGHDPRLSLIITDANRWLKTYASFQFDLIFADALPGKYENFENAWNKLALGGFYVIDDMLPHDNWPDGHHVNVERLLSDLDERSDCKLVRMCWSSGLVIAARTIG